MQKLRGMKNNRRDGPVGALVVSIHDVSPVTLGRTREILADLAVAGVERTSLLVIPDHHRRGLISKDAGFAGWLREACGAGHEVVLHGYFHLREARPDDGWKAKWTTGFYTAGEGEFFDLSGEEAVGRIAEGLAALGACGVKPAGFIAPAWLLGAEAEQAVRRAGFSYTTRIGGVIDFGSGLTHRSRSLVWSVRAGWRRVVSLGWNAGLMRREAENALLRIGIHPPDWEHPEIRRQVLAFVRDAVRVREAMTYEDWLGGRLSRE